MNRTFRPWSIGALLVPLLGGIGVALLPMPVSAGLVVVALGGVVLASRPIQQAADGLANASLISALFMVPHQTETSPLSDLWWADRPLLAFAVVCAAISSAVGGKQSLLLQLSGFKVLGAFLVWAGVTIWLAEGDESQYFLLATYALLFLAVALRPSAHYRQLLGCTLIAFTGQTAFAVLSGMEARNYAGVTQLTGGMHPNVLAFQATMVVALVGFFWQKESVRNTWARIPLTLSATIALCAAYATISRSALLALAAGVLFAVWRPRGRLSILGISLTIAALVVVLAVPPSGVESYLVRDDASSIATLTGRTEIWQVVWSAWMDQPLLGYGFGGLLRPENSGGAILMFIPGVHAHNAFLQVLYETGLVGLALFVPPAVMMLGRAVRQYLGRERSLAGPWLPVAAFLVFVNSFANGGIALPNPQWVSYLVLLGAVSVRQSVRLGNPPSTLKEAANASRKA